jgi:hypothetical protein
MNGLPRFTLATLLVLATVAPLVADNGPNHRKLTNSYGSSGGNAKSVVPIGGGFICCSSGTLGGLVRKSGKLYILSNDHVFGKPTSATHNSAVVGDPISQPGLIDNQCVAARTVGNFSFAPTLSSGVDAGIAARKTGTMNTSGSILDVGVPASTLAAASVGTRVAKSGRTTGLTCGKVTANNATVNVGYDDRPNCGQSGVKHFTVQFKNQVVVQGTNPFSSGGDSGALIVKTSTAQPLALLFAGNSTVTIGNPIGTVLSKLGATMVGGSQHSVAACVGKSATVAESPQEESSLSEAEMARATTVKELYEAELMRDPAVIGVAVGANEQAPSEAVVLIFVNKHKRAGTLPKSLAGVRTKIVYTEPFRAIPENRCRKKKH